MKEVGGNGRNEKAKWGENEMTSQQVLETLEKQLQLLSERSKDCSVDEQVKITGAMVEISHCLLGL